MDVSTDSPIALTGNVVLWISFVVAAYGVTAGIAGNVKKSRRLVDSSVQALYAFFGLMLLASALIIYAFVTHDYAIKYVAKYSDTSMPLAYKLTAYWGGLNGSMMFWAALLSVFSAIAVRMNREKHRDMIGFVVATIMVMQVFFLAVLIYAKNPFDTYLTTPPLDGEGLNPLLQNYWMVIHPPSLYIGFVAAAIPFSFGIGALASGRLDDRWLSSVRTWTFISFFFLSFGLILGGRWAYEELGWGGYWAWDPVENAGLLPWFTATAFLHAVIVQEQRGMMKVWNLVLVILTFFLTIYGTFMTRSGIVQSVHAFGEDNELALLFILFLAFILIVSFGLLMWRLPKLRSVATFESFMSREFAYLLNNWILLGCAVFVLFATMFPTISESINGERITVGPDFFNKWMTPLGLILLFLAGAAPLLAYRRTTRERLFNQFVVPINVGIWTVAALALFVPASRARTPIFSSGLELPVALVNFGLVAFTLGTVFQEFWRGTRTRMKQTGGGAGTSLIGLVFLKRRKYGGYLIHMSIAVMFVGFAGKTWTQMEDFTVAPGEVFAHGDYLIKFNKLSKKSDDHMQAVIAEVGLYKCASERSAETVALTDRSQKQAGFRALLESKCSKKLATMRPERRKYRKSMEQATTEVDIKSYLDEDVYVVLTGFEERDSGTVANFRVYINPLINWVWIGFGFLMIGTALCLMPQKWVDGMMPRRRSRIGKIAETAAWLLAFGGVTFGMAHLARADQAGQIGRAAKGGAEYSSGLGHDQDVGFAHRNRPSSSLASELMHELVCTCGGCQRESIYECKCGYAMERRGEVLALLAGADTSTPESRKAAYDNVIAAFVQRHGQKVISTPRSSLSWSVPLAIAGIALLFVFGVGRMWVRRGQQQVEERTKNLANLSAETADEAYEDYNDMLDDELRDTD